MTTQNLCQEKGRNQVISESKTLNRVKGREAPHLCHCTLTSPKNHENRMHITSTNTLEYFDGHSSSSLTTALKHNTKTTSKPKPPTTKTYNQTFITKIHKPLILRHCHSLYINRSSHPYRTIHKNPIFTKKSSIFLNYNYVRLKFKPNWKEGKGGESSWSHRFLPLRWVATMVFPVSEDSKTECGTPSMTFASSAATHLRILLPTQCSSRARRAASTSGSSGMTRMLMLFGSLWFVRLSIVTIWRYINRSFLPRDLCENLLLFNLI